MAPTRDPALITAHGEMGLSRVPAGLGSRVLASLVDHLVLGGFLVLLLVTNVEALSPSVLLSGLFGLYLAYFTVPEMTTGRTVGKAALDLRVIREDGAALDPRGALVRNLIRAAWVFPILIIVELSTMIVDRRMRRLGDLLAGTRVVSERRAGPARWLILEPPPRDAPSHDATTLDRIRLSPAEYAVLRQFCLRTRTLSVRRRHDLLTRLLAPLCQRAAMPLPSSLPKQEDLVVDLLHQANGTWSTESPHSERV